MNKYFVNSDIYKDRLAICRECVYYFSLTGNCKLCGCFMKIKARLGNQECPKKYWAKTTEVEEPDDLPQDLIDEVIGVWGGIKTGRAKNIEVKKRMIELYNTIYGTNYSKGTNCGSCLDTRYNGIKKFYEKYK